MDVIMVRWRSEPLRDFQLGGHQAYPEVAVRAGFRWLRRLASGVFLTFYMKDMVPLRVAALFSNVAFLIYGVGLHLMPVVLLHGALIPINIHRLVSAFRASRMQAPRSASGPAHHPVTSGNTSSVRFDEYTMWIELADGRTLRVPLAWFPRLLHATPAEREQIKSRIGLHWDAIDEDISVAGRGDVKRPIKEHAA